MNVMHDLITADNQPTAETFQSFPTRELIDLYETAWGEYVREYFTGRPTIGAAIHKHRFDDIKVLLAVEIANRSCSVWAAKFQEEDDSAAYRQYLDEGGIAWESRDNDEDDQVMDSDPYDVDGPLW